MVEHVKLKGREPCVCVQGGRGYSSLNMVCMGKREEVLDEKSAGRGRFLNRGRAGMGRRERGDRDGYEAICPRDSEEPTSIEVTPH